MPHRLLFRRHVALPADHGSWVLLLSPLLIGLFAGGTWSILSLYLLVASLCAFLIRQPITLAVKIRSGRRNAEILPAVRFWIGVYSAFGLLHVLGLVLRGFGYVLFLAVPGVPVFAWYLLLVSRRTERRQWLIEVLAAGALALAAPAAFWVGVGTADPLGWLLWILTWAQSAAAIGYAYLRLEQRVLDHAPRWGAKLSMGRAALIMASLNLGGAIALGLSGVVSRWLFVAFAVQWSETIWGTFRPAMGLKPRSIGYRQLLVSTIFTLLFIVAWRS